MAQSLGPVSKPRAEQLALGVTEGQRSSDSKLFAMVRSLPCSSGRVETRRYSLDQSWKTQQFAVFLAIAPTWRGSCAVAEGKKSFVAPEQALLNVAANGF